MNRRNLILLMLLALLSIAAAGYALWQSSVSQQSLTIDRTLFPDLEKQRGDVARIEIVGNGQSVTLVRSNKAWALPQKDNYPADAARVNRFISILSHLILVEKKTAVAARYGELKLDPPGKTSDAGTEVKLIDAKGAVLADAVIGRAAPSLGRVGGGFYARRTDQPDSWLVEGTIEVPVDSLQWAHGDLFDLYDPTAIKSARLMAHEKPIITVTREKPADETFTLAPAPPGKTDQGKALRLITLPVLLPIEDVTAISNDDEESPPDRIARFKNFSGTEYILQIYSGHKDVFVKAQEAGPGEAVKRFNEFHAKWLYKLPPYRAELLNAGLGDFSIKDPAK